MLTPSLLMGCSIVFAVGYFLVRWLLRGGGGVSSRAVVQAKVVAAPVSEVQPREVVSSAPVKPKQEVEEEETPQRLRSLSTKQATAEQLTHLRRLRQASQSRLIVVKEENADKKKPEEGGAPKRAVELTKAEWEAVEIIKQRIKDEKIPRCTIPNYHASDDRFLGRFVRGKKGDVERAWEQVRASLLWRAENKIDTLLQWYRAEHGKTAAELDACFAWQAHGVDNYDCVVYWDRLPSMDFKLLMEKFNKDELMLWHLEQMEHLAQWLYREGRFGFVFIEDFTGLSLAHWHKPAVDMLKHMMNIDQSNYPEFSWRIFYINAPRVFTALWPLLKPFMDPLTVEKIHIASDSGVAELCVCMPSNSVPREYGGTCQACAKHPSSGTCLNYSRGGSFLSTPDLPIWTLAVPARSAVEVPLEADDENKLWFRWVVKMAPETDDIEMSILDGSKESVLKNLGRARQHNGAFLLPEKGTYYIRYGNTFSFMSAKVVGYNHTLHEKEK